MNDGGKKPAENEFTLRAFERNEVMVNRDTLSVGRPPDERRAAVVLLAQVCTSLHLRCRHFFSVNGSSRPIF